MTATLAVGAEYGTYRKVLADNALLRPSEWSFKGNPDYRAILEHVSPQQGEQYLEVIQAEYPRAWAMFRDHFIHTAVENDQLGQPVTAYFKAADVTCSPTNWRYLLHAMMFWRHVHQLGLKTVDVVEIGGGYGGLALWIWRLASSQQPILRSYTIIDVPEAGAIQQAFCREVAIPVRVVDGTSWSGLTDLVSSYDITNWPYLISMYAFSEFSRELRDFYQDEVVSLCEHGMLVWNMIPLYPFTEAEITSEAERPLTGPGNLVVRF